MNYLERPSLYAVGMSDYLRTHRPVRVINDGGRITYEFRHVRMDVFMPFPGAYGRA